MDGPRWTQLLVGNARAVRTAMDSLIHDGFEYFLEVARTRCYRDRRMPSTKGMKGVSLSSLRRGEDERAAMLGALGSLYAAGFNYWEAFRSPWQCVRLPAYPWQRERHWSGPTNPGGSDRSRDPSHHWGAASARAACLAGGDRHSAARVFADHAVAAPQSRAQGMSKWRLPRDGGLWRRLPRSKRSGSTCALPAGRR
jgi:acyl transferase domain-containing protein